MAPAIPCSFGIVTLSTKTTFCLRKEIPLATSNAHQRSSRVPGSCGKHFWLQPESLRLLQKHGGYCRSNHVPRLQPLAAIGADVAMEEQTPVVSSASGENSIEASPAATSEKDVVTSPIDAPTAPSKRTGSTRKSETPRLKDDDLVPGATFMGKVVRIQPFGAFVDFGAFTNGLVHISNLSDSFVKDVGSVVSVGQEVEVRLLDVNMETKRISLTMCSERETFNNDEGQQTRSRRRNMSRSDLRRRGAGKHSKFEGELFDGTVKTLGRSGSIITLSDGREGFLPLSEESDTLDSVVGSSSLQVGDEVRVRILRTSRGQLVFTMKRRKKKGPKGGATFKEPVSNKTFSVLFRQNLEIASFLDEREQMQRQVQEVVLEGAEEVVEASSLESQGPSLGEPAPEAGSDEFVSIEESIPEASSKVSAESEEMKTSDSVPIESSAMTESYKIDVIEPSADNDNPNSTPSTSDSAVAEVAAITTESVPLVDSAVFMEGVSRDANPISSNIEDSVTVLNLVVESISETVSEKEDASMIESGTKNDSVIRNDAYSVMLDEAKPEMGPTIKTEQNVTPELVVPEDINTDPSSGALTDEKFIGSELSIAYVDEEVTSDSGETNSVISSGQDKSKMANSTTAIILPALVKKLREETGAGMMDCKNALVEMGCDIAKAQEFLRKKGLASAEKRAGKVTEEGQIGSYVHDSRIGVMIEVNCETDFVSRGEIFKELVQDLAMQVAACPQVQYLVPEDVPEEVVNKEREIEMQKEDLQSKPEQFRSKIVDGRINKRLQELALLEQPYIKNDKLVVKDLVKQAIASVGENINVKRFVRFNLGEGLEKRNESFAAEVAAQTSSKTSSSPPVSIQEPVEANEVKEKAPVVVVSAALVKQLREETGAGMMDCKKALAESEGVLEKAHDYLRKKGIASAAKKSSRITAEGRVASYIHDSRIGALIEVNSETDFVARNEKFKELVNDLAMQVVACPQVEFVSVEEISENVVAKEREIEMQREDIQSKPEHIREKIVEGRISKRLAELALLEQPFIKDDSLLVKDLISQTVAALGENIKIRRFARFTLGE